MSVVRPWLTLNHHQIYDWYDKNQNNNKFFIQTNTVSYEFWVMPKSGVPVTHIGKTSCLYDTITNKYNHILPNNTMYLLVVPFASTPDSHPQTLYFVTPRRNGAFIWGDHYTLFKRSQWKNLTKAVLDFHKTTQNVLRGNNLQRIECPILNGVSKFRLKDDGKIDIGFLKKLKTMNGITFNMLFANENGSDEIEMIRDLFGIAYNSKPYDTTVLTATPTTPAMTPATTTIPGGAKRKRTQSEDDLMDSLFRKHKMYSVMIIKINNGEAWNMTVEITKTNNRTYSFGVINKNTQLSSEYLALCVEDFFHPSHYADMRIYDMLPKQSARKRDRTSTKTRSKQIPKPLAKPRSKTLSRPR